MSVKPLLKFASRRLARLRGAGRTVVLKYHSVLDSWDPMRPDETTAQQFDAQMDVVASSFRSQTFGSFVMGRGDAGSRDNTVVVTFDDGYRDNHDVALPILQKYGLKATFFVASDYVNGGMMWNDRLLEAMRASVGRSVDLREAGLGEVRVAAIEDANRAAQKTLSAIKRWPGERRSAFVERIVESIGAEAGNRVMMNAKEVAALADAGMEIGAHTLTHPILSTLSAEQARVEIAQSKIALERITGREIQTFAYPNGIPGEDFTEADVQRVKEAGYIGAATTKWGCATPASDNFRIPRQSLWGSNRGKIWYRLVQHFSH